MEEIRRTKIKEAMKETLNVYEKLDLNSNVVKKTVIKTVSIITIVLLQPSL